MRTRSRLEPQLSWLLTIDKRRLGNGFIIGSGRSAGERNEISRRLCLFWGLFEVERSSGKSFTTRLGVTDTELGKEGGARGAAAGREGEGGGGEEEEDHDDDEEEEEEEEEEEKEEEETTTRANVKHPELTVVDLKLKKRRY
ncbi:hypothetical protein ElyMa_005323900 [Elysia marginata]|uniref:Uncharacterized protein n=1 Tax=Elysia marginata TaxID=1093978 RepID=A0AAV4K139_9GAST|nr:hypothetical protein ElyMa_005323900 [Elysia marginata]